MIQTCGTGHNEISNHTFSINLINDDELLNYFQYNYLKSKSILKNSNSKRLHMNKSWEFSRLMRQKGLNKKETKAELKWGMGGHKYKLIMSF